ncbi:hypothetical protein DSO57_1006335 [Entomophthora muscae]|uniref:Uncharacterized protein n=1 Tax=Entomophthora muscae TaxID=34485 RepID=A0ACC2U636_9FUNG|nr:hypothetical protein DSO57_1006335 [Entomophthora muscae]
MGWQGDDDTRDFYYRRHRSDSADGTQFEELVSKQKQDSEKIMGNGQFGTPEGLVYIDGSQLSEKRFLCHRLHLAQSRGINFLPPTAITSAFVPNSRGQVSKRYPSRVYSGQFSQDGTFFFSCTQDFKLRIFDVTDTELIQKKEVQAFVGQWTITDGTLSNDNKWLAYSSITPMAFLTKSDPSDTYQFPLIFSEEDRFGIWSLRFSSTGKELVAGTSDDSIMILDIETGRVVFRQKGHHDDVNAVCFADPSSNIIFSGSDDGLIKVWDRRSLHGEDCAAAGALVGHTSGITYVSAKGDGRYCLSNGKDQTMKLWDIRKLVSVDEVDPHSICEFTNGFDYRYLLICFCVSNHQMDGLPVHASQSAS